MRFVLILLRGKLCPASSCGAFSGVLGLDLLTCDVQGFRVWGLGIKACKRICLQASTAEKPVYVSGFQTPIAGSNRQQMLPKLSTDTKPEPQSDSKSV